MAITGVNTYNNAYENVYATKQKEETKETSAAQKKTNTENKGSLLNQLQDKYSNFDITAGTFSKNQVSSSSKGFQGVMISSAYLSKAENDEATAKDLDEMLSGVESAYNWLKNAFAKDGLELVSCGYYIDENGKMGSYSVVEKKHSMFDGLAEQSEKSADRIKEKQDKAREQKKADEKKAEKKKAEEKQEQQVKSSKDKVVVVASSNEELLKKAKEAANETNEKVLTKEEKAVGNNFDLSI
ncbi:MAG: hypothetical protein HDQ99_21135 [Lachnospiraceae bacterium]|nr:hypothetical protein [Lachnospiraceae bacterium]MBD5538097.1 hypothetical protein [Lachnospiraceae bacterium]